MPPIWEADWTSELLEIIWTIERLIALESDQQALLSAILDSETITIDQLTVAGVFPVNPSFRSEPRFSANLQEPLL
jgi:hypothetical protein